MLDTAIARLTPREADVSDQVETYLNVVNLGAGTAPPKVEYYLVDHAARLPFWFQAVNVHRVGLEPYDSEAALRKSHACGLGCRRHRANPGCLISESVLTAEYWTHVDYFPSHRAVDDESENELISVLRHDFVGKSAGGRLKWST